MFRLALLSSLLTASLAFAGWTQEGPGSATFDAKGNVGLKIHGVAKKATVTDDGKNLTVTVKIADVDTENGLRNSHMAEDMEATKYPDIVLSVPLDGLKLDDGTSATAKGTFTIHGKSKEVPFKYKVSCKGACTVDGSADLNLKDFDVKIRSYLGVTVKPEITVGANFTIKK
ncbi:MAG: YceI family protein [Archangium sp.]